MITVIMATRNGGWRLAETLASFERLQPPSEGWRLIVVDNDSEDNTADILKSFQRRLPLTILHEYEHSQNVSLNTALRHANGDLIVKTDDDVQVDPSWLREFSDGAQRWPDHTVFGGQIRPHWPGPPPDWVLAEVPLQMAYAVTNPDWREGTIQPGYVFGANFACRRTLFDQGFRFDPSLGPRPGDYIMGGETDLFRRAHKAGWLACHLPRAAIHHRIRSEQLDPEWVLARAHRFGRSQGRFAALELCSTADGERQARNILTHRIELFHHSAQEAKQGLEENNARLAFRGRYGMTFNLGFINQFKTARANFAIADSS